MARTVVRAGYADGGSRLFGVAVCRAGHDLALPGPMKLEDWCWAHRSCRPAWWDRPVARATMVLLAAAVLVVFAQASGHAQALLTVLLGAVCVYGALREGAVADRLRRMRPPAARPAWTSTAVTMDSSPCADDHYRFPGRPVEWHQWPRPDNADHARFTAQVGGLHEFVKGLLPAPCPMAVRGPRTVQVKQNPTAAGTGATAIHLPTGLTADGTTVVDAVMNLMNLVPLTVCDLAGSHYDPERRQS